MMNVPLANLESEIKFVVAEIADLGYLPPYSHDQARAAAKALRQAATDLERRIQDSQQAEIEFL